MLINIKELDEETDYPSILNSFVPPSNYRVFLQQCRLIAILYGRQIGRLFFEKHLDNYVTK